MKNILGYLTISYAIIAFPIFGKGKPEERPERPEKVEICHMDGKGNLRLINVSSRSLEAHLANGALLVGEDVDENCEELLQVQTLCITGKFPGYADEKYQIEHDPVSGMFTGFGILNLTTYAPDGPFYGTITPAGSYVLTPGTPYTLNFTSDASYGSWTGTGITDISGDGVFSGSWSAWWGTGPATYLTELGECAP